MTCAATCQLRSVPLQPWMADREYIVRVPELVGIVALDDPHDLVHDIRRAAPAMRVPEHRVRTPPALVRAAARRDQVDAARSMMLPPDVEVLVVIDRIAIR